ncbi:hypothetical protein [Streptomyces xanthii]|uniref:Lipoprotein n=1 Tax=Streptomyces xanthii TaxID=2768069 RepID=A0A7H1B784_9ACTN|nr:hypothetical protein [Streptomyces xanthii]QNS04589.1 hypothetical protein IAG42_13850 [Streptomyces xanthii]
MKSGLGRTLAGVGALVALTATAGCGGGADDGGKTADKPSAKASATAEPGPKPLGEAQLKKAALAQGDVKGYRITPASEDEIPDVSVPADPASCQAIADLFFVGTEPDAEARVARSVISTEQTDATLLKVGLLAHEEANAKKILAEVREESEKCHAYEHTDYQYKDVKPGETPKLGDEAVAFTLRGDIDGDKMTFGYTVVRSGSTLVVFQALNALGGAEAEVPDEVVKAQMDKLEKQA